MTTIGEHLSIEAPKASMVNRRFSRYYVPQVLAELSAEGDDVASEINRIISRAERLMGNE